MTRFFPKAAAVASVTLLFACGGDIDDASRQQALQRAQAPSSYMSIPVMTLDSVDKVEGYAFGYSAQDGWHWGQRVDVDPGVYSTPVANGAFDLEKSFKEFGSLPGGAYTFSAMSGGVSSFRTSLAGGFPTVRQSSARFSASAKGQTSFSPTLGAGSGGSCDLTVLCDAAADLCSLEGLEREADGKSPKQDCSSIVAECRQAVYSTPIPAEVQPYICIIADFVQCLASSPSGFEQADNVCVAPFLADIEQEVGLNSQTGPVF